MGADDSPASAPSSRRRRRADAGTWFTKMKAAPDEPAFEALAQDEGAAVLFKAAGAGQEAQEP